MRRVIFMPYTPSGGGAPGSSATYRGTSSATNVASGNPPAAIAGHAIGDSMYAMMLSQTAITPDANWITLNNTQDGSTGVYQYIARRVATTSNGLGNDRFMPTYSGSGVGMYIFSFYGVDGTASEGYALTQWAGTSATVYPPNATPTLADSVHIVGYAECSNPHAITTPPPGYTVAFPANVAGGGRAVAYYKKLSGQAGIAQGPINLVWAGVAYGPAWTAIAR